MQRISIGVVRARRYRATDAFHIYSDRATGTIDWTHPVTPRRIRFWEDAPGGAGQHLGGFLLSVWMDGVRPDGHLEGAHLLDERGYPAAMRTYLSDPLVCGRFRYAVTTEDDAGNALSADVVVHELVVNSAPPPAADLRYRATVFGTQRWEFTFTPSTRLRG